jgi:hypothetical protein
MKVYRRAAPRYPKNSAWKRSNWDKWTIPRKLLHIVQVFLGLITIIAIFLTTTYIVLMVFGVYGFLIHIRDTILLGIMHSIFG